MTRPRPTHRAEPGPPLRLTENEALVTLASVIQGSVQYAQSIVEATQRGTTLDREEWESLFELQTVVKKLQRLLKMPDPVLFELCAAAGDNPGHDVFETLLEAQRRIGGRQ